MAKMFYTLEETAEKLGISGDEVRDMATGGKLQQFRDRDKLMFKRDQVDALTAERRAEAEMEATDELDLADLDSGVDKIDLAEEPAPSANKMQDSRMRTGISVFDADEIEMADPLAQTIVTKPGAHEEDELVLEGVGSGSGLLDLTRESDDTSLGAELLDEIYPGSGGEGSDIALDLPSSSGSFESPVALEAGSTGLDNLQPLGPTPAMAPVGPTTIVVEADPYDPAGNGLTIGMFLVCLVGVVILGIVIIAQVMHMPIELPNALTKEKNTLWIFIAGLAAGALILGAAGFLFGMARAKRVSA